MKNTVLRYLYYWGSYGGLKLVGGVEAQDVNSGSDAGVVHIQGCHLNSIFN